ncbi:unnamed protein product [Nezara viridula]|uniref:PH domain-containing protein n=1 Tax=Nezara viridula TaxID=85310 RepID=A0A9P0ECN7_NEZVI|nr:unnamed protein product [Nezara viridula]
MMASFSRKSSQKSSSRRSHSLIESPIVKRIQNQPVTLQSWLLKRGSEGLMLWKKRWCVLSDYCLFYYKDQSEEKLLGSLILASYEISACNPEEKGFKKFSFKAEHANMKTFYFAAENQLHMEEWMKALKCASLLEGNYSDDRKKSSDMRIFHQSNKIFEESQSTSNNDMLSGNQKTSEAQPVYVNAPPKPKRLNESSSPECSIEIQIRDDNYHTYLGQPYHIQSSLSGPQNFTMQPQHANYERRTPDIYGRASFVHPVTKPVNLNNLYIQDEQNIISNFSKEQIISYTPKHSSINSHSRPHSVDFLEYHSKNSSSAVGSDIAEKPSIPYRPKSSLSAINSNEEEGTHWSAEEYARKMRQSSISQHVLDNNDKPFFRSASARLFRATSPVTPTNEFKLQTSDHKVHETPGSSRDLENPVSNLSPINKQHMPTLSADPCHWPSFSIHHGAASGSSESLHVVTVQQPGPASRWMIGPSPKGPFTLGQQGPLYNGNRDPRWIAFTMALSSTCPFTVHQLFCQSPAQPDDIQSWTQPTLSFSPC